MKCYCVYKHTTPCGKVYIGITSQKPSNRWQNGKGYLNNEYFLNAIRKYGWSNIKHEVLFEGLSQEEAEAKEVELISFYKSYCREFGYNISMGGRVNNFSEETRQKMRESHLGSKLSEEQRRKMSEKRRGEKHWCYGSKRPLETRRKISEAQKGRKPWCAGKNLSEEHKTKISLAHTGMKPSPDTISKWKKSNESIMAPVEQIDVKTNEVIKRFDSLGDASRMTGVDSSSITKCCRGKRATAGGFVWRYITAG